MARRLYSQLLVTTQFVILLSSKRFIKSVYRPYGPQMCDELRRDSPDVIQFVAEDLSCHRLSTNDSRTVENTFVEDSTDCLRQDRMITALNSPGLNGGVPICEKQSNDEHKGHEADKTEDQTEEQGQFLFSHHITLHQACEEGNLCVVQAILTQNLTDINLQGYMGRTPVMAAAGKSQVAVFDYLVRQGCDLMAVDENNDTVLHHACKGGSIEIVTQLVIHLKYDVDIEGGYQSTPVMVSTFNGHIQIFDFLVCRGCNLTAGSHGYNILHTACQGGHVDMVSHILSQQNIDINSRGLQNLTPVIIAAHYGYRTVVKFLHSSHCNIKLRDSKGSNILHHACVGGGVDVVKYILTQMKMNVNGRGESNKTPVMFAAQFGHMALVEVLVKKGCNLRLRDSYKNTVLHIACMFGHRDVVGYILSRTQLGINSQGICHQTPVMIAAGKGHAKVVEFLVSKNCKLTDTDSQRNNILHLACVGGNVAVVQLILSKTKLNVDGRGNLGMTPAMFAARFGHRAVIEFLVSKGCNLGVSDVHKNNILHIACVRGDVEIVKFILKQDKPDINSRGRNGETPVMIAAFYGHLALVEFLVNKNCKLSGTNSIGNNILHLACVCGHLDVVRFILSQAEIDLESKGQFGLTPAMSAVSGGYLQVIKFLVSRGCKLTEVDSRGNNILHVACVHGHLHVVKYILSQNKSSIESKGIFARTPVMLAAQYGRMAVIKFLIEKQCKLTESDTSGKNLFLVASIGGHLDVVKYLLTLGLFNVEDRDMTRKTAVMVSALYGHRSVVEFLVEEGCNLKVVDIDGNNVLHVACEGGHVEVVNYLIKHSIVQKNIRDRNASGKTPLQLAQMGKHVKVVEVLHGAM